LMSKSNCFLNIKSWRALIFSFWSVIILLILYVYVTFLPASGLLKSTSVRPRSDDRIFTNWPSRESCIPFCGSIFCAWKCFVGIIRMSCGFLLPNACSGFRFRLYCFPISFPSRFSSNPVGSILWPIDRMKGFGSVFGSWLLVFGKSDFIFVSKISFVFDILPVNSISMKSFLFVFII